MRARLALYFSGQAYRLREVSLKSKPLSLITYSPKATVPVLIVDKCLSQSWGRPCADDLHVIDESLDIMHWALSLNDPYDLYASAPPEHELVEQNDTFLKPLLDRYKYFERYSDQAEPSKAVQTGFRQQAEAFIQKLEKRLCANNNLCADSLRWVDLAIFPFVRQFAHVDLEWFENSQYLHTREWLNRHKSSEYFQAIMKKYPVWQEGEPEPLISP